MSKKKKPNEVSIEIPQFLTHIRKSKTSFIKINGQRIFVGMNHHLRSLIVRRMHLYLSKFIPEDLDVSHLIPLKISLELHVPRNYEHVRMSSKGKLTWKKPKEGFNPKWDADNMWIWGKCFNDVLVRKGILPDDNVSVVKESGSVKWMEVETLEDRKLIFKLKKSK